MASCPSPKPFISAPGGLRLTFNFVQSFGALSWHMDFFAAADPVPEYLELVAAEGIAFWNGDIGGRRASVFGGAFCTAMELTTPVGLVGVAGPSSPAGLGFVPAPNNLCIMYHLRTAGNGRSAKGAIFEPNIPTVFIGANGLIVDPLGMGPYVPLWTNFMNSHRGAPFFLTPVVWSYCSGGSWRSTAIRHEVIAVEPRTVIHSRRKRLFGR